MDAIKASWIIRGLEIGELKLAGRDFLDVA
jgi:hypothetical protein